MTHTLFEAGIEACNACSVASNHCVAACLQEPDVKSMASCIAWAMDCADICTTTAAAMARHTEHAVAICKLCATICKCCANECIKHASAHCQHCAQACKACAEACLKVIETVAETA